MLENYCRFNDVNCYGYYLDGFDIYYLFKRIKFFEDNRIKPFYQSEQHRKVFYDKDKNVYIKVAEEKASRFDLVLKYITLNTTSDKYFKYFNVLKNLNIPTPELLACLKIKQKNKWISIIATKGILHAQSLGNFLSSVENDDRMKALVIKEFARVAATIHNAGYYFSMDLRNILVTSIDANKIQLFILDLEHMKNAGVFAKRRLIRNLSRFRRSLLQNANGNLDDYNVFLTYYKELSKSKSILTNT